MATNKYRNKTSNKSRSRDRGYKMLSVYEETHTAFMALAKLEKVTVREFTENIAIDKLKNFHDKEIPIIKELLDDLSKFGEV